MKYLATGPGLEDEEREEEDQDSDYEDAVDEMISEVVTRDEKED